MPKKNMVVIVMGATGSGKSKLAMDLASHFPAEIVNSDKIQVYAGGLDVLTNKVTPDELAQAAHHLIGFVDPDDDFTASDFRYHVMLALESITERGKLPIIAGGSNSYIEELIDGNEQEFRNKYDCCFIWVDAELPVLHSFVSDRVDRMVEKGLVDEVRGIFDATKEADYTKGVRRAIGVAEMDEYLRAELRAKEGDSGNELDKLLGEAIDKIKANTCALSCNQVEKIQRLSGLPDWNVHRVDATEALRLSGEEAREAWEAKVKMPSIDIVQKFIKGCDNDEDLNTENLNTVE